MQEDNLLTQDVMTALNPEIARTQPNGKPATKQGVPDKFWNKDKEEIRVDALLKSYLELEKKLSSRPAAPSLATDYKLQIDHDLFTVDDEINARLHAAGFTDAQAQLVYDLAAEKMVPLILELARDFEADREIEKLVKTFGGAEKWRAVAKQLLAYGRQHLPADVVSGLSGSYEGVMALYRLMQNNGAINLQDSVKAETALDEQALKKMMNDPKYWRDRDRDMVGKVTAGFKQIFNT